MSRYEYQWVNGSQKSLNDGGWNGWRVTGITRPGVDGNILLLMEREVNAS